METGEERGCKNLGSIGFEGAICQGRLYSSSRGRYQQSSPSFCYLGELINLFTRLPLPRPQEEQPLAWGTPGPLGVEM